MRRIFVVTGTDTGVGKTVFAAALVGALEADYWKPVQAGLDDGGDRAEVARLSGRPDDALLPEAYRLRTPASPHLAATIDGLAIEAERLALPHGSGRSSAPLIVEGAGGVAVPLSTTRLFIDQMRVWNAPVIIVARTTLGTINHSLLTIEALRARAIPIHGIAFVGDGNADSEQTIVAMGGVRRLGRLPLLPQLEHAALQAAFRAHFTLADFA